MICAQMENWIETQVASGRNAMVLGDFNRKLNGEDGNGSDHFWTELNDGKPDELHLVKGPGGPDNSCWRENSTHKSDHIDFIVANTELLSEEQARGITKYDWEFNDEQKYPDYEGSLKDRLSDHCPVVLTLPQ